MMIDAQLAEARRRVESLAKGADAGTRNVLTGMVAALALACEEIGKLKARVAEIESAAKGASV